MAAVTNLRDADFFGTVEGCVTLVDFWAPWCSPCLIQGPIVEQVANEVGDKAKVAKVNIEEAPEVTRSFGIQSIPTLIIFKDGQPVKGFVGVTEKRQLIKAIETACTPG